MTHNDMALIKRRKTVSLFVYIVHYSFVNISTHIMLKTLQGKNGAYHQKQFLIDKSKAQRN